ncbi:glycosyltransferase family 4 protein [Patescibacteria group bacterium]|nr:glycosyltransferase family 4 protein [Patescibacteria group bacterium]
MRLLLVTGIYPPDIGGPATVTPLLAAASYARGWETEVITYGDETTDRSGPWKVTVVSRRASLPVRYARMFVQAWRQARRADLVFLQGSFAEGLPGMIGAKLAGCPAVLRLPGGYAWEHWQLASGALISLEEYLASTKTRPWKISLMNALEGWVVRSAKRVFVPSRYICSLLAAWKVESTRLKVIYNLPVSLPVLLSSEQARQELNIAQGKRILLTLARGIQTKRVDFLIGLLPALTDTYLVCLGEGERYAAWREEAIRLGVSDRFITPGRVDRLQAYHYAKAADAFVLASHTENYPFAAIEMALAGLPCFLSDRGGNKEAGENFPDRITILPYEDQTAWIKRLQGEFPRLEALSQLPGKSMVDEYLDEIESLMT